MYVCVKEASSGLECACFIFVFNNNPFLPFLLNSVLTYLGTYIKTSSHYNMSDFPVPDVSKSNFEPGKHDIFRTGGSYHHHHHHHHPCYPTLQPGLSNPPTLQPSNLVAGQGFPVSSWWRDGPCWPGLRSLSEACRLQTGLRDERTQGQDSRKEVPNQ